MGWLIKTTLLIALQCVSSSFSLPHQLPRVVDGAPSLQSNDYYDATKDQELDMDKYISGLYPSMADTLRDQRLQDVENYLAELLLMPNNGKSLPLLYIEEGGDASAEATEDNDTFLNEDYPSPSPEKRNRYYRKYPWKRQNPRHTYDAENRYVCQPNKDDVYRLLVALHETRQVIESITIPIKGRTISFCNRKRPAGTIFTNIRFLG